MRLKKQKTIDTEAGLHRFTHQLLKLTAFANVQFLHIPNGLQRAPRVAAMLKGMGAKNGAADFLVIVRGKAHWLELKNGKRESFLPIKRHSGMRPNAPALNTWLHQLRWKQEPRFIYGARSMFLLTL